MGLQDTYDGYPTGHGAGCQCPGCDRQRTNDWYARNDTRMGGGGSNDSPPTFRSVDCPVDNGGYLA